MFRAIFFLPVVSLPVVSLPVVSLPVAAATAWEYLLHPTIGPVNWLGSSDWLALPGTNGVRITQTIVDTLARVVAHRATPEAVLADVTSEVQKLRSRG